MHTRSNRIHLPKHICKPYLLRICLTWSERPRGHTSTRLRTARRFLSCACRSWGQYQQTQLNCTLWVENSQSPITIGLSELVCTHVRLCVWLCTVYIAVYILNALCVSTVALLQILRMAYHRFPLIIPCVLRTAHTNSNTVLLVN